MDCEQGNNIMKDNICLIRRTQQSSVDGQKRRGAEAGKSWRRCCRLERCGSEDMDRRSCSQTVGLGIRGYLKMMGDPKGLWFVWPLSVFITFEIKTEKFKSIVLNYLKITIINP